jgi:hypothetical protein
LRPRQWRCRRPNPRNVDALVSLIDADVAAGRLRPDLDADAVVSLLMGSYLGELLRRGVVADDWLPRCAELLWHAIT